MAADSSFWADQSPEMREYYDNEWGQPNHDDRALFELLCLETYQTGLSWQIVLRKRAAFRLAFYNYDIKQVAGMTDEQLESLLGNQAIIRNRAKLRATVDNACAVLEVQQAFGSFNQYLWQFVDHQPIVNRPETMAQVPTQTPLSVKIAKDMKKRGFKFVGPVTVYSFMEGSGLVDDRLV